MRTKALFVSLIVVAVARSATAAQADTFDMICDGTAVDAAGASTPFTTRFSIDLSAKQWCDRQVGCPYIFPIRARRGDDLTLLAVKTPLNEAALDVDLKTGIFSSSTRIPDRPTSPTAAKGICRRADFTPLK